MILLSGRSVGRLMGGWVEGEITYGAVHVGSLMFFNDRLRVWSVFRIWCVQTV